MGLSDSQTRKPNRMAVLLLLGALIAYALWLTGLAAIKSGFRVCYGSKKKASTALSTISLAQIWLNENHQPHSRRQLQDALQELATMVVRIKI